MTKRLISILLVCCMAVSTLPLSAGASAAETAPDEPTTALPETVPGKFTPDAEAVPDEMADAVPDEVIHTGSELPDAVLLSGDPEEMATLAADDDVYAILYNDGTMVFQYGNTPESGRMVSATYRVNLERGYGYIEGGGLVIVPWPAESITKVDFADIIQPQSTRWWLSGCANLTEITNIANLDTSNVTDMSGMFSGCSSLTELDLSSFDTSTVTNMENMFYNCSTLSKIYVSDSFVTTQVGNSTDMFTRCTSLVGGAGTQYSVGYTDATYAHIDGGTANPGYFTDPNAVPVDPNAVYAILYNDGTMVFQYGNTPDSGRTVTATYEVDLAGYTYMTTPWYDVRESIIKVDFADTIQPRSTSYWFFSCTNLTEIANIDRLDTSNVTNMSCMFNGCSALTELDVSGFDTVNVTDMDGMFNGCSALTGLDVSGFDTVNVTDMGWMFNGCSALTALDLSNFDTTNVTDMSHMFNGCSALTALDLSNFDTTNVTSMYGMFTNCSNLIRLNLSNFNNSNVTTMREMFLGCRKLSNLNLSNFNTANVIIMSNMFYACESLAELDVSSFNTASVTNMYGMFSHCESLINLDLHNFDTANVTDMADMFYCCICLRTLDVSRFNTVNVTRMGGMFDGFLFLEMLDLTTFNTANVTDMHRMFADCTALSKIYASDLFVTTQVENSDDMFINCTSLVGSAGTQYSVGYTDATYAHIDGGTANPGYFTDPNVVPVDPNAVYAILYDDGTLVFQYGNTPETGRTVIEMYPISASSSSYEGHPMPEWAINDDITKVDFADIIRPTSTSFWFTLSRLTEITNISRLDTSNVTDMFGMFYGCSSLTELDVSHFDTSNVTDMSAMFYGCSSLTELDLRNFNTANVIYMSSRMTRPSGMFEGCSSLTELDVSSFDTSNVINMRRMFADCTALSKIYVSDSFVTTQVENSTDMFTGCTSLVGGAGTQYRADYADATYAHIDGGTANPGYFTDPNAVPVDPNAVYAILYDDGTLVFQYGNIPESGRTVTAMYEVDMAGYATSDLIPWYGARESIAKVDFADTIRPRSTAMWFNDFINLTEITNIDRLDTSDVTDMQSMFSDCSSLTALDLSSFNTANVTDMAWMFSGCDNLTTLDVSGFDTSHVTNMSVMFFSCNRLSTLDLSSFDTSNVTQMNGMFGSLTASTISTIYASDSFVTTRVTDGDGMFLNARSLVGGAGTQYSVDHSDATYARIDNPPDTPGYFTDPNAVTVDDILDRIPDMTRYENQIWRVNRDSARFASLSIDGVNLTQGRDYTVSDGSTRFNIPARTFARFGEGFHTITAQFNGADTVSQQYTVELAERYRINAVNTDEGIKYVPYSGKLETLDADGNAVSNVVYEILSDTDEDGIIPGLGLRLYTPDADPRLHGYFDGTPQAVGTYTFTVGAILNGEYLASISITVSIHDNTETNIENDENVNYARDLGYFFEDIPNILERETNHELTVILHNPENSELIELRLDGRLLKEVGGEWYFADADIAGLLEDMGGGTAIVLAAQTMNSLNPGKHTISAKLIQTDSESGRQTEIIAPATTFYITGQSDSSQSGSSSGRKIPLSYTVTLASVSHGSVHTSVTSAQEGSTVSLTAEADAGYALAAMVVIQDMTGYSVKISRNGEARTFVMPACNVTVKASFNAVTYRIAAIPMNFGSLSATPTSAHMGDSVTITARPEKGYTAQNFTAWTFINDTVRYLDINDNGNGTATFTMPAGGVEISAQFEPIRFTYTDESGTYTFTDIGGPDWFFDDAVWAHGRNVLLGQKKTLWVPNEWISSVTTVVAFERLLRIDMTPYWKDQYMQDWLPNEEWYTPAARWAADEGILTRDNFTGRNSITRGELAVMMTRFLKYQGVTVRLSNADRINFPDSNMMTEEEREAFWILRKANVFQGDTDGKMNPQNNSTRAHLAALMHRLSVFIQNYW